MKRPLYEWQRLAMANVRHAVIAARTKLQSTRQQGFQLPLVDDEIVDDMDGCPTNRSFARCQSALSELVGAGVPNAVLLQDLISAGIEAIMDEAERYTGADDGFPAYAVFQARRAIGAYYFDAIRTETFSDRARKTTTAGHRLRVAGDQLIAAALEQSTEEGPRYDSEDDSRADSEAADSYWSLEDTARRRAFSDALSDELERVMEECLTDKQRAVVGLSLRNLSVREVGRALGIGPSTVQEHLERAIGRLTDISPESVREHLQRALDRTHEQAA